MKYLYVYIACLLVIHPARAEKGHSWPDTNKMSSKGSVQVRFQNHSSGFTQKDSVLIIFDRYNHTGAGVIYQVFYKDQDHSITIPAIPPGKYYVTIQCMGVHHDRLEKVVRIQSKKNKTINVYHEDSEEFSKDRVVIPPSRPDWTNLSIVNIRVIGGGARKHRNHSVY